MIKKFILLMTVLLAGLTAQAATDYGFEVAGTPVTSANCNNITNSYITSGTVYYTPSTNTLHISNATISCTGSYKRAINNLECSGLKIEFSGICNLMAQDAAVVRIRKTTTLYAPATSTVVNITGINDVGIWLATSNDYTLTIQGPGRFDIYSKKKPAIEDQDDSKLDRVHEVFFDNVRAQLSSEQDNVARRFCFRFKEGSSVRLKATNNSSKPLLEHCGWQVFGNVALLEPYRAYFDGNTIKDSNGNSVYDKDVYVSDDYVAILNDTYFPGESFRKRLLKSYPKGYITSTDVANCSSLNLSSSNIHDITGIEYFTNLTSLNCYGNLIQSVDLKHNTLLEEIDFEFNSLTSLDVSNMTALKTIKCPSNKLTSLNINGCTALQSINCSKNRFTTLNITNTSNLQTLTCGSNSYLTELNVTGNKALVRLNVTSNTAMTTLNATGNTAMTTLDVTGCKSLTKLQCRNNSSLTTITGLADCTAMTYLDCQNCALTDVSATSGMNNLTNLYVSNNKLTLLNIKCKGKLTYLGAYGNPLLTEINCDQCALTYLDVSNNTALQTLICYNNWNLATINGLADCKAMKNLNCANCALTTLDVVNGMNNLERLDCANNKLTSLAITDKSHLTYLDCRDNKQLTSLQCYNNALVMVNVTGCSAMQYFSCAKNKLSSLSLSGCNALISVYCNKNKIAGENMTNLVNSLPMRSESNPGTFRVLNNTDENNVITEDQLNIARNKYWNPKRWNGTTWEDITSSSGGLLGDFDNSKVIDVEDVNAAINIILKIKTMADYPGNGDMDNNGFIDVEDVNAIINIILKQ